MSSAGSIKGHYTQYNRGRDYYPFGMVMPEREYASVEYKYAYNGKEKDMETSSGALAFEARMYDSRICRFLSVDPLRREYPGQSVYNFAANSPILLLDVLGMGPGEATHGKERTVDYKDDQGNLKKRVEYWDATVKVGNEYGSWVTVQPKKYVDETKENKALINANDHLNTQKLLKASSDAVAEATKYLEESGKDIEAFCQKMEASIARTDQILEDNTWTGSPFIIVKETTIVTETKQVIDHSGSEQTGQNIQAAGALALSSKDPRLLLAAGIGLAGGEAYLIGQFLYENFNPEAITIVSEVIVYHMVYAEHTKNKNEANRKTHEKGKARKKSDRGGEKGDSRRSVPRKRPPKHTGPWP